MIFKIVKKIFLSFGIVISLIFIFLSLHSYFILRKVDSSFMLTGSLFSGVCLIIFLLLFFDKIKFINNALDRRNYRSNILIGICSIIISITFIISLNSPLLKRNNLFDIGGIIFFGLGGLALFFKGIEQKKYR